MVLRDEESSELVWMPTLDVGSFELGLRVQR